MRLHPWILERRAETTLDFGFGRFPRWKSKANNLQPLFGNMVRDRAIFSLFVLGFPELDPPYNMSHPNRNDFCGDFAMNF